MVRRDKETRRRRREDATRHRQSGFGRPTPGALDHTVATNSATGRVLFGGGRNDRYAAFSNFHGAEMMIDGKSYATVEHWFQACKARTEAEHDIVRRAPSAMKAKQLGRRLELRRDWDSVRVEVMRRGLEAKFSQHAELRELLLSTGSQAIHEDARHDFIWGWGRGAGRDLLGKLLMEVREGLRAGGELQEP